MLELVDAVAAVRYVITTPFFGFCLGMSGGG
jgi:hypothetical protein